MAYYTSLFKKDDVRITTAFSVSHKGIDLSRGVVEQPIYFPKKAVSGEVWKILAGYTYNGKYYKDAPIIYIKHKDGSGSRYIHSYPKNVKVKVGDKVVAGQQVCATGNSGYSFGDHLHFEWLSKWDDLNTKVDPTPYVINDNTEDFKIGDKVIFIGEQNIRTGSGTSFEVQRMSRLSETAIIKDGPRVADGYTWWDMKFENGSTGWVAEVGKFEKYIEPPIVEPPQPPEQTECEKEVERLKEEIKARETDLTASQGLLMIKEREYEELESDYSRVKEERDRFESQYMDVTKELNELKEGRDSILKKIGDVIYKLFKGIN